MVLESHLCVAKDKCLPQGSIVKAELIRKLLVEPMVKQDNLWLALLVGSDQHISSMRIAVDIPMEAI